MYEYSVGNVPYTGLLVAIGFIPTLFKPVVDKLLLLTLATIAVSSVHVAYIVILVATVGSSGAGILTYLV